MKISRISIDSLIELVTGGGTVKTGVDIYNKKGILLLEKDVLIKSINPLLLVKNSGVFQIPVAMDSNGGLWDRDGRPLPMEKEEEKAVGQTIKREINDEIDTKLQKIAVLKKEATYTHEKAKKNYRKVLKEIQKTGGEFDVELVQNTVDEIFEFVVRSDNAFAYLAKEIISFDNYLYNHSINVCAIGTAILKMFNDSFSGIINKYLATYPDSYIGKKDNVVSFVEFLPEDLKNLSLGYFLHDVGKVLIPPEILNKKGPLTPEEFEIVKGHSFDKGVAILKKNNLDNTYIRNITEYHHGPLFIGEGRCYPNNRLPIEIPLYVKICKLADIYDAMTSKRCYKDAMNPTGVVKNIFNEYADKDHMLQFILHSFVKSVGIYPPGSIIFMATGQMAYVVESQGPIVIPFTDKNGKTLAKKSYPVDLGDEEQQKHGFCVDRRKPLKTPIEVYDLLPEYLKAYVGKD
ncbi:MAG: HD domain-containing protein [Proteobacteria bacterium]|nr:HD domain-containing protein [Pseudomonadota bacterium]MBU1714746.1 HD domain-containing protein [Pseudomonadota bacterium]